MKRKYLLLLLPLMLVSCKVNTSSSQDSVSVSDSSNETLPLTGKRDLHFLGINDFHGAINESDTEPGIFRLSSYIKAVETENNGNVIKVNAGDYWQGSADSNMNRGRFLTKAMNLLTFDAFTLGNHEFDWFDSAIEANKAVAEYPFLGANIFAKATNKLATNLVSYDSTFKRSTMVTRDDVNIGIIGTIGSTLENTIFGAAVEPYVFSPLTTIIKEEAANLRKIGAHIIVLSTHDSLTNTLGEYKDIIDENVVDMIFSGHYHTPDDRVINGIPILQTAGYGKQVMEVAGSYDFDTSTFSLKTSGLTSGSRVKTYDEDAAMLELFAPFDAESSLIKNEVVGSFAHTMTTSNLASFATKVLYDYGLEKYPGTKVASAHNLAGVRKAIKAGTVTYGDIYETFPFDNEIRIIEEMKGSSVANFIGSYVNYTDGSPILANENYTVVTIDYISTYSNYTKDLPQVLTGDYVRDLIADYMRLNGEITSSDYS